MITKKVFANGSFGIYSRKMNQRLIDVYFCGGRKDGRPRTNHDCICDVCAHSTKTAAEHCPNKVK